MRNWGVGKVVKLAMRKRLLAGLFLAGGMIGLPHPSFGAYAEEATRETQSRLNAEALAQRIASKLSDDVKALEFLSRDEGLIKLLETGDETAIAAKAQELTALFKSALKLRLIRPGTAKMDTAASPPLSFASLDMLHRAETTDEPIPAEFHKAGSSLPHIVMIQRVRDRTGQLVGLIHLALNAEILILAVRELGLTDAYLEIDQPVPEGAPLILAKSDTSKPEGKIPPKEAPVPGTRWIVKVYASIPEQGFAPSASQRGGVGLLAAGAILTLVLGGGWLIIRRRQSSTETLKEAADTAKHLGLRHPDLPQKAPPGTSLELDPYEDTLELSPIPEQPSEEESSVVPESVKPPVLSDSIFRAYDIRGVVGETLTEEAVYQIGRAIGSEAQEQGQQSIVIARDGRTSSPALSAALQSGLRESGRDVIDIGMVPTPVLYFATHYLRTGSGVMVTGSHNPSNYNGLKIVLDGQALSGGAITAIRDRIRSGDLTHGQGDLTTTDIVADYIRRITEDIPVALSNAFKVVVDCGNGVPGVVAPQLLRALGHDVIELYCEVDGTFPHHHPDPSQPKNLKDLIETVRRKQADLGLAFDGDGDRLGVVDGLGTIIWPDRQMMLFARGVLARNPGAEIIFDVKCSSHLKRFIEAHSGRPVMWKTGHSLIKAKMKESGAPLAGEMSGHIFFKERWYGFDDALYASARLLEILVKEKQAPAEVFAQLPGGVATPELRLDMPEEEHARFMEGLIKKAAFENAELVTVDGLRVDFPDGWGLIRPSNTTPSLILRFEADDEAALKRIQKEFRALLQTVGSEQIKLPF